MSRTLKRIERDLLKTQNEGWTASPINDDLFEWNAIVNRPTLCPDTFPESLSVVIDFQGTSYPYKCPRVKLENSTYTELCNRKHRNNTVISDEFRQAWSPQMSPVDVLEHIQTKLYPQTPSPEREICLINMLEPSQHSACLLSVLDFALSNGLTIASSDVCTNTYFYRLPMREKYHIRFVADVKYAMCDAGELFLTSIDDCSPLAEGGVVKLGWVIKGFYVELFDGLWLRLPPYSWQWWTGKQQGIWVEPFPHSPPRPLSAPLSPLSDSLSADNLLHKLCTALMAKGLLLEGTIPDTRPTASRAVSCAWCENVLPLLPHGFTSRHFVEYLVKPLTAMHGNCRLIDLVPFKYRAFIPVYFISHSWDTPVRDSWGGFSCAMIKNDSQQRHPMYLQSCLDAMMTREQHETYGLRYSCDPPGSHAFPLVHTALVYCNSRESSSRQPRDRCEEEQAACGRFGGIWMDVLAVCQHSGPDQSLDIEMAFSLGETSSLDGGDSDVLSSINHTVLCPGQDSRFLTRSWCCYEIAKSNCVDCFTTTTTTHANEVNIYYEENVRVQEAQAWNPVERDRIHDIVLAKYSSFEAANTAVSRVLMSTLEKRSHEKLYEMNDSQRMKNAKERWFGHFNAYYDLLKLYGLVEESTVFGFERYS